MCSGFQMMSSRHLDQYKVNFYKMDEVLIANLPPTKVPVKVSSQSRKFEFNVFSIIHLNGHTF